MFDEAFAKFTKAEMAERLTREEIAWAPAQTLADVAEDAAQLRVALEAAHQQAGLAGRQLPV